MNELHQKGQNVNFEETFPGCLGRMGKLFDLNVGVAGKNLLTDKPHRDGGVTTTGSPLSRSQSDIARMNASGDQMEDKVIVSELRRTCSNRKTNGTPMKMLTAQEMSKEKVSKRNQSNVVAKLMGLDTLPGQQPESATRRIHSRGYPRSNLDTSISNWEQKNGFFQYAEPIKYKDVYEIGQQSDRTNSVEDKSRHKGRNDEITNITRMTLVRQKFIEAKCLSMDEKLCQSKQFQDALEVLSSNKDLFLACLQEPNEMLSQHLYNLQSIPPPETKRITVLRPSKVDSNDFSAAGNNVGRGTKKNTFVGHLNGLEKSHLGCSPAASWNIDENPTQPTQILLLKPSPGKPHNVKAVGSRLPKSPMRLHGEDFFGDFKDDENQESRKVAKAITWQMSENLGGHQRDETLLSSVYSNGYVSDEKSLSRSEIEHAANNLSGSEVISQVSRQSWDYVNRFDRPFSSSSSSHASYSPQSSVCKEAKKRLSERWAMMTYDGSCQERRRVWRCSSTLGEMLALSETKNAGKPEEEGITIEDPKDSNPLFINDQKKVEIRDSSPTNLLRLKYVPASSNEFSRKLDVKILDLDESKSEVCKQATKVRNVKSSLKGKVSSLFSSRNKKPSNDMSSSCQSKDESHSLGLLHGQIGNDKTECLSDKEQELHSPGLLELSSKSSSTNLIGKRCLISPEVGLSVTKPITSGNSSENQDQQSPISVLDPPFEEDEHMAPESSGDSKLDRQGLEFSIQLIEKSPPIGSIACTLSWDDSCMDTASSYPLTPSSPAQGAKEEEREWFFLVRTLLSVAGLDGEVEFESFLARWHLSESPLDPSLRDKYMDLKDKETLHEAKRRQKRSTQKLVFDCVNAALVDIAGYGSDSCQRAIPCTGANNSLIENASFTMEDQVWAMMKTWFSGEVSYVSGDCGNGDSQVVEKVVRNEVVGKRWLDHFRMETGKLGKEIETKLLDELVQEAVAELTGGVPLGCYSL